MHYTVAPAADQTSLPLDLSTAHPRFTTTTVAESNAHCAWQRRARRQPGPPSRGPPRRAPRRSTNTANRARIGWPTTPAVRPTPRGQPAHPCRRCSPAAAARGSATTRSSPATAIFSATSASSGATAALAPERTTARRANRAAQAEAPAGPHHPRPRPRRPRPRTKRRPRRRG